MSRELYVFGSLVRGEVDQHSDVDILVVKSSDNEQGLPSHWTVMSEATVSHYFQVGHLFAWHLHLEAVCIFSDRSESLLSSIGPPSPYSKAQSDVTLLVATLEDALNRLKLSRPSVTYNCGIVQTCLRDIGMCAAPKLVGRFCFSKYSPFELELGKYISMENYRELALCRISSTRSGKLVGKAKDLARRVLDANLLDWAQGILKRL